MKLVTLKSIAASTVLAALSISRPLAAQEAASSPIHYSVINLGTLGGSASNGYGGVNNRGWVTGDANLSGDQTEHAFLWRNGVMTDLGTLGGPNSSVAFPVKNNRGLVAGTAQINEIDPLGEYWGASYFCTNVNCQGWQNLQRGFRWQNDVITALSTLGGNNSTAFGVNDRGHVVGIGETATQDPNCVPPQILDFQAVIWGPKPGQIQELPVFPGDAVAAGLAINDNGQVVGTSGVCAAPISLALGVHAVLWQHSSVTDLGGFGGVMNNAGLAINNAGQVVGISDLPGDTTAHAFFWQNGVMTDLGTLPGDVFSEANDINRKGQAVGISCDANFNCRAFLWEKGVMTDLNTLVAPGSSLYLTFGGGINDRGEITGTAFDQNTGDSPAFLAIPCDTQHGGEEGCGGGGIVDNDHRKLMLPENIRKHFEVRFPKGPFGFDR
jgi:probable HAF family extracellular repeat protein